MSGLQWERAKRNPRGYEALSRPLKPSREAQEAAHEPWQGEERDHRCAEYIDLSYGLVIGHWKR